MCRCALRLLLGLLQHLRLHKRVERVLFLLCLPLLWLRHPRRRGGGGGGGRVAALVGLQIELQGAQPLAPLLLERLRSARLVIHVITKECGGCGGGSGGGRGGSDGSAGDRGSGWPRVWLSRGRRGCLRHGRGVDWRLLLGQERTRSLEAFPPLRRCILGISCSCWGRRRNNPLKLLTAIIAARVPLALPIVTPASILLSLTVVIAPVVIAPVKVAPVVGLTPVRIAPVIISVSPIHISSIATVVATVAAVIIAVAAVVVATTAVVVTAATINPVVAHGCCQLLNTTRLRP